MTLYTLYVKKKKKNVKACKLPGRGTYLITERFCRGDNGYTDEHKIHIKFISNLIILKPFICPLKLLKSVVFPLDLKHNLESICL